MTSNRTVSPAVRYGNMPDEIAAVDSLASDYFDVFAVTVNERNLSAEEWARIALEQSSAFGRFVAWRTLLGLRLGPQRSPDHVAGWKIIDNDFSAIRIEASSILMTANIVFRLDADRLSFATLIRYDSPVARLVWTPVAAIHRHLAPEVLRSAIDRVDQQR